MMGVKYFDKEHAAKGMMVHMFQDIILQSNHLLLNGLFKQRKTPTSWR
jgi:hypothetical protein